MLKIPMKKNQYLINIREKVVQIILTILKILLSIQMTCKMFTKILMNAMQIKSVKYLHFLMI